MMCVQPTGEASRPLGELGDQAVIEGVVAREGDPLPGAYVRLLDRDGEFTAEVRTDEAGRFRFYTAEGAWTLRTLAPGSAITDERVEVQAGHVVPVEVLLG